MKTGEEGQGEEQVGFQENLPGVGTKGERGAREPAGQEEESKWRGMEIPSRAGGMAGRTGNVQRYHKGGKRRNENLGRESEGGTKGGSLWSGEDAIGGQQSQLGVRKALEGRGGAEGENGGGGGETGIQ